MHKALAGLLAVTLLCSCMTSCSQENSKENVDAVPDSSDSASVSNSTEVEHENDPDTETSSGETFVVPPKGLIQLEPFEDKTADEVKEAVDKALTAYRDGDTDGIVKYSTMEFYYFTQFGHPSESDKELKEKLKDNRYMVAPMGAEEITWETEVYSFDDEFVSDMKYYLETELPQNIRKAREESSSSEEEPVAYTLPTLEELSEAYNISNICVVNITSHYPDTEESSSEDSSSVESSSIYAYVFKIDGEWRLDFMYTQSYSIYVWEKENEKSHGNDDPC